MLSPQKIILFKERFFTEFFENFTNSKISTGDQFFQVLLLTLKLEALNYHISNNKGKHDKAALMSFSLIADKRKKRIKLLKKSNLQKYQEFFTWYRKALSTFKK